MKRIFFILSLILMIGIQAKAISPSLYEGACLDSIQQDISQDFVYNCNFDDYKIFDFGTNYPFITPTVRDGYFQELRIDAESLYMHASGHGNREYLDILLKAKDKYNNIYNCYIRIQFIYK